MVHALFRSVVIAAVFTLVGCAGPTGDPQKSASKSLGVEGGQVTAPNGVGVTVPSGALRRATTITLTPASADQVRPNTPSVGEMYEFGPEGQVFDVPARVKLEVDLSRLPAGYSIADVVVQRAPAGSAAFEALPTRIVDSTHVEADTLHFSVFVPTLASARGGDGGVDAGIDGGACTERCVSPNDGGADCECSRVCGAETLEIQCSGSSPLGCACVRNGVQVGSITALVCPGVGDLERLCGFPTDAGVDGGTDGGSFDGGTDGGTRLDGGIDGGSFDGGTDGGIRPDGGSFDGGSSDAGSPDAGSSDAGRDAGSP
ncbi:MAG: hypothetical protein Q8N23_30250 [Archangium sp.]|nr:hypothetical protein [Archangium sp.]MDP3575709.1 hypothetical protein [Archangium sp.]